MNHPPLNDPLPFFRQVWDIVRQVPKGSVTTFGQIASMFPPFPEMEPKDFEKLAPRWVGDAMNAVSRVDEPTVPWHRVINSKGMISLPDESVSAALQRARLRLEGVMDEQDRVNLSLFGWGGPPEAWLAEKGLLKPRSLKPAPKDPPGQLRLFG